MSGQLRVEPATMQPDSHARVVFHLVDGRQLIFSDTRKFGRIYLTPDPEQVAGSLGPEPLGEEFTPASFLESLTRRKGALKPLLLNQTFLAGLGNIYTDEALFAAGLHPLRKASSLTPAEAERLYVAIRAVLQCAIGSRGTTLPDARYRDAEGNPGGNQQNLCVYQRCGEPCVRCGTPIERIVVGQRGTHYCPSCQKM
jgi:formamidopyrimidine-DNA glycosylase